HTDRLEHVVGPFDLVVSNPPYIPSAELAALEPEVRRYDPIVALDGGADGLNVYRDILAAPAASVVPGGWCAVEVGAGQAEAVVELVAAHPKCAATSSIRFRKDLGGHTRCVAWRPQR